MKSLRTFAISAIALPVLTASLACGGSNSAPAPITPASDVTPTSAATTAPSATSQTTTTTTTTTAHPAPKFDATAAYDDGEEFKGTKTMTPLLAKGVAGFPPKTVDEAQCWANVSLSGNHSTDYNALTVACGTPGGLLPYVAPVTGKLHSLKDQTDVFSVKLNGGLCYRYFAVADETIHDIDILVEKPGGAIVADDKQDAPVAIIEAQKSWCQSEDETYEFHVRIDGEGTGAYTFGIWARPQGKSEH